MGDEQTTLVLGGTGKTGRRVAERLWARNLRVRVGSTAGEPPFDWNERATWAPVLEGVGSAYVSYYPDLAMPGAPAAVGAFAEQAVQAGVRRLVLLSGRGEVEAQRAEQVVQGAGAETTIVRCSWFSQNFSEGPFQEPLAAGELALPADGVPVPFVDADDIADVAVAALSEDGHAGRVYELTGPRPLTFAQAVAEIAGASGREIRFRPIPMQAFAAGLAEQRLPSDIAWLLGYLFSEVLVEDNAAVADGVQRALGRAPRDFRDYARDAAATGVWGGRPAAAR